MQSFYNEESFYINFDFGIRSECQSAGQTISYEQALSSMEQLAPEKITMNLKYNIPVATPGITKFK